MTETKRDTKKVCEEGDKNAPLFFGVLKLETLQKKILNGHKKKKKRSELVVSMNPPNPSSHQYHQPGPPMHNGGYQQQQQHKLPKKIIEKYISTGEIIGNFTLPFLPIQYTNILRIPSTSTF